MNLRYECVFQGNKVFRPEPAGRQAGPSSRCPAAPGHRADHTLGVGISVRRALTLVGTGDAIAGDLYRPVDLLRSSLRWSPSERCSGRSASLCLLVGPDDAERTRFYTHAGAWAREKQS